MASSTQHVDILLSFSDPNLKNLSSTPFNVPINVDPQSLNNLVNATIRAQDGDWNDKRFELLIRDTFLRTTLAEFIEEFLINTETAITVECVLAADPPKPQHDLPAPDWISTVTVLPHHVFATTFNGFILSWNKKGKRLIEMAADPNSILASCEFLTQPTGKKLDRLKFLVGGMSDISVFELQDDIMNVSSILVGHERRVSSLDTNANKTRLLSGSFDNTIKVWNLETLNEDESPNAAEAKKSKLMKREKKPLENIGQHNEPVTGVKWASWNPTHCVSASLDRQIVEWDVEIQAITERITHTKAFNSIDLHKKTGFVVAASTDPTPRLYDLRSREDAFVKQSFVGHNRWVSCVAWHKEQENVFVSGAYDNVVKMWDIRSAKTSLFDFHGHSDRVLCISTGDDGTIASGGADSAVKTYGYD